MAVRISEELEEQITVLLEGGLSHSQISERLGIGRTTVSRVRNRKPISKIKPEHPKPQFDREEKPSIDCLKVLDQARERVSSHPTDRDYCKIAIKTKKPIAVMKAADFHFGGLDVDYVSLYDHVKFLLDTPNFYLQLFGDDLNLMIMHRITSARHDGWTPEEQVAWLESFVDKCLSKGKLLSMCWGNHTDEFTERNAGFGLVRMLMKHKVPYFRGLGYIDLVVGKNTYPMGFTHKVRFHSFMNALHGNKRMEQLHPEFFTSNRPICKEYITAHTHYPAISTEGCLPEERIHFIKCGTFKTNCLYSQRYYGQGRIGVPTVVYHPNDYLHVLFATPYEAATYLKGCQ